MSATCHEHVCNTRRGNAAHRSSESHCAKRRAKAAPVPFFSSRCIPKLNVCAGETHRKANQRNIHPYGECTDWLSREKTHRQMEPTSADQNETTGGEKVAREQKNQGKTRYGSEARQRGEGGDVRGEGCKAGYPRPRKERLSGSSGGVTACRRPVGIAPPKRSPGFLSPPFVRVERKRKTESCDETIGGKEKGRKQWEGSGKSSFCGGGGLPAGSPPRWVTEHRPSPHRRRVR